MEGVEGAHCKSAQNRKFFLGLDSAKPKPNGFAHKLRLWHHSGFQVWVGRSVPLENEKSLNRPCAYIHRPSFASARLNYQADLGQIEYKTKKGIQRSMDALDWIDLP